MRLSVDLTKDSEYDNSIDKSLRINLHEELDKIDMKRI